MMFLVAMFAAPGCASMLDSVFLSNFKPFGVSHSLGERLRVFSVGNVELFRIGLRLACDVHRVH